MQTTTLTAIIHQEDDLFVAECPEVGVPSQGHSIEESLANLKEATELYLEEFPQHGPVGRAFLTTLEAKLCPGYPGCPAKTSSRHWSGWDSSRSGRRAAT